jgi:hypothetical protein
MRTHSPKLVNEVPSARKRRSSGVAVVCARAGDGQPHASAQTSPSTSARRHRTIHSAYVPRLGSVKARAAGPGPAAASRPLWKSCGWMVQLLWTTGVEKNIRGRKCHELADLAARGAVFAPTFACFVSPAS